MNLKAAASLAVGVVEPQQAIEGMISCQIATSLYRPAFELYIEDDLGRESRATSP